MSGLPIVDAGPYFAAQLRGRDGRSERHQLATQLKAACHDAGMFYLIGHQINCELIERVLVESSKFFDCDDAEKLAISMKNSAHFRGFGRLKNSRDWREQIHIGVEAPLESAIPDAKYRMLEGPNQWPLTRAQEFSGTMLEYMGAVESLARIVLDVLCESIERPFDYFTSRMNTNPYLLMKSMSYLPQQCENVPSGLTLKDRQTGDSRIGVTAHCDWSWLTFLIQDDVGGLEALDAYGVWQKVEPVKNALVVNTGELLELETGGYFRASPHRVINERIDRQRFSIAVFVNPALDEMILPMEGAYCQNHSDSAHVHKVIRPGTTPDAFVFGDSEWKRKAEGLWCYRTECLEPV